MQKTCARHNQAPCIAAQKKMQGVHKDPKSAHKAVRLLEVGGRLIVCRTAWQIAIGKSVACWLGCQSAKLATGRNIAYGRTARQVVDDTSR